MKFKSVITKEVIDKSWLCETAGWDGGSFSSEGCAFAVIYNELVPHVQVGTDKAEFFDKPYFWGESKSYEAHISSVYLTPEQANFIRLFDALCHDPMQRYLLVGREFELEIPDEVIEYWYKDAAELAAKIANTPSLTPIGEAKLTKNEQPKLAENQKLKLAEQNS